MVAGESNTARNGLLCQYQFEDGSSQFIFLHIGDKSGAVDIDRSLSFCTENYVQVISSCKGFLLLASIGELELKYHVFNPMSRQVFTLPQPAITRRIIRFRVSELQTPPLFSNGAIHWEISGYLLVYQVEDDLCDLIELPNFLEDWSWQSTMTYKRCLSEFQGRVHYTYTDFDGVHSWILLNEQDHDYYSLYNIYDRKKFRWALADSVNHQDLNFKHQEIYSHRGQWHMEPYDASPLSFSEDSETMYLQLPGFLVSYNTRTKVLEEFCTYIFPGVNFNCCMFLPFTYGRQIQAETESESLEVGAVRLPIKDKLDTLAF
ncbi:hypothetical protein GH714_019938 [Hevea brasiliensis]|uniref:F-box associated domain-containing protein n=1 Tax=Hevea brasiliensis TaxID=3981 RepID=A0A6A6L8E0_HEVBR|nr:hypothetical protein GH714_019938 [Hevea brasiliensis]